MRILNVTQSYAPFFEFGGPPAKVRALAEGMAHKGHDVTVLTADWGVEQRTSDLAEGDTSEASPFGRRRKVNGVTAIYLANWLHYHAASWNPALGRYLRARLREFDVVHIFGLYDLFGPRVAAECRKRNIPYIVEPIGMFVPIVRNIWLKRMYHRIWGSELLEGAAAIIATAEQERDELIAGGIPANKIELRRNGIEAPAVLPERGKFRREQKIPEDAELILFLGRLSQKKSPDMLLQAFAEMDRQHRSSQVTRHLAFVGPDESGMKARLKVIAKAHGLNERVHFSSALAGEAKWSAYRDADIFVLPSQNENFGNTAGEAVAVGTPVIVTEECGIAPLLKDVAGLVVGHNKDELRKALASLLDDKALLQKLQNGCKIVMANLGWGQPLEQMEAIYCRLATGAES